MGSVHLLTIEKLAYRVFVFAILLSFVFSPTRSEAFTLNVVDTAGNPVTGFKWLVEEDTTHTVIPGLQTVDTTSLSIHKSYAPVVTKGSSGAGESSVVINIASDKRYMVSVLPFENHTIGAANVAIGQGSVTVMVNQLPLPTAQIKVLVWNDNKPLNNEPDVPGRIQGGTEEGLEGFSIQIADFGGAVTQDAFGNPLGTTYQKDPNTGEFLLDAEGSPVVLVLGDMIILTGPNGEATIKYLAPGKYAVIAVPPPGEQWYQTSTIEGTPVIDAWIKPNEPEYLVEFVPPFPHVFFGFVQLTGPLPAPGGGDPNVGTITGRIVKTHSLGADGFLPSPGPPITNAFVGLNTLGVGAQEMLYVARANADGTFTIDNVPAGLHQIVVFDLYLDSIFAFHSVVVPVTGGPVDLGDIFSVQWFGQLEGYVFYDSDRDGFMDAGETGMPDQAVLLRFRDGSVYQVTGTNPNGYYLFPEVFPFFKWLVTEIDFGRFFATGMTAVVDAGGAIPADDGWNMPSDNKRNPQEQTLINPNTNNNLSRTELAEFSGEILLEAIQVFNDQSNRIDWGKADYVSGENGGISGIVFYATTRAEDDPRFAAGEEWEPGIPFVQINLYEDSDADGVIDDVTGNGIVTLADVDNYPVGWIDGDTKGPEDIDRNNNGLFDAGDAINVAHTDSWDDSPPEGCIFDPVTIHGVELTDCLEGILAWNQVRPGVFDGGYAITSYFPGGMDSGSAEVSVLPPGTYIVECAAPLGYEHAKEENKNVDFGDSYIPSPLFLPPISVGDLHLVPDVLTLFPDVNAPFAGEMRPLPDRKQITVSDGSNAAAVEFFLFTEVPKAGRVVGFATDDQTNEPRRFSPNWSEKFAPPWVPISIQDYQGNEVVRVYSDEFGVYNALVPSTYTVNVASPSGVSPAVLTLCMNHPGPVPDPANPARTIIDPHFKPQWSTTCYNFEFWPGRTTYTDTPVIPIAAFVGIDNYILDCEFPDKTPLIYSVSGPEGGPYVSGLTAQTITITSVGLRTVPNPDFDSAVIGSTPTVVRNYSFGSIKGSVSVGLVELAVTSWSADTITATVPAGIPTGQLTVVRGENGKPTPLGVTLTVGGINSGDVIHVTTNSTIQQAIDDANSGALILVEPGQYDELLIMYKNVKLQGSGAFSTIINATPFPTIKVADWRAKLASLRIANQVAFLTGQDPNLPFEEGAGVTVLTTEGEFAANPQARIDGFEITGSGYAGGIFVSAYAHYLEISNNKIARNLGSFGGGIRIGHPALVNEANDGYIDAGNDNIDIHNNQIIQNGGLRGGGGIAIFTGADNYQITDNFICGNRTQLKGAGIGHDGLSSGGWIADNTIGFNEAFYGTEAGGEAGGIYIGGLAAPAGAPVGTLSPGSGSVSIVANLIQGNLAGSGDGGGILTFFVNGQDVVASPSNANNWYEIDILNNMIVNNIAGVAGAVTFTDTARCKVINNTIANNDSTATGAKAFPAGQSIVSTAQPAGILSYAHSTGLANAIGAGSGPEFSAFSNPILQDNIIYHNRSFFWNANLGIGAGELVPNVNMPYWDLAVIGNEKVAGFLEPSYSVLSVLSDDTGADYDNGTNIVYDPLFLSEYFATLITTVAADEGGNFINVRPSPLKFDGDYHIRGLSLAINAGDDTYIAGTPELAADFDVQVRPFDSLVDIGADETGVVDDFNDGDFAGWTVVDKGTFEGPSAWSAASGVLIQSSNIYSSPTTASGLAKPGTCATFDAGSAWIDYEITLDIKSTDDDAIGAIVRFQDSSNFYRFCWDKQRSFRRLVKEVDGVCTLLAGDNVPYVTGQTYELKIRVELSTIEVRIDGSLIFSVTDSSHDWGTMGLYSWGNAGSHFDNIEIEYINRAPVISVVTASPSTSVWDTRTTELQVTASDPDSGPLALSYSWSVQAGQGSLSSTTIANPVYTPPDVSGTQTYTISVQVFDGIDTTTGTVNITVRDADNPGPVTILTENFNDGNFNGWNIVDQGTFLAPSSWSAASGTMTQSSNIYSEPTLAPELNKLGTMAVYTAGNAWTDYKVTSTIRSDDDDGIGLLFRYQDTNNYYKFCWDKQRSYRRLIKKVGGTVTLLASDSVPYVTGQNYQVEITATGSSIIVAVDSSTIFSVIDNSLMSGTMGLYSWGNAGSFFDNITVEDFSSANLPPTISSVTASPSIVLDSQTSQLSVTATDPDFGPFALTYNWIVQAGQGSLNSTSIANPVYTPPDVVSTQNFTITVEVSDGVGTISSTVTVTVKDAASPPLLTEDFTDGDFTGWTIIDEGTLSAPSDWSAATGTMVQSSNIYSEPTASAVLNKFGTMAVYDGGNAWTDYQAALTIRSDDDDEVGLLFRYQDTNNYYKFCWDKQRSFRRLMKKNAGQVTLLAADSVPYVTSQDYQLQVTVSGSSIQVRIDGSLIFSVTDTSLSSGTIALYSWGNVGSNFDDISVDNP